MKYAFVYCFMLLATLLYGGIPYASAQESYTASLEETGDNIQNAEDYLKSKSQSLEKYLHRSARIQKRLLKKMKVTESGMAAKLMKTDSVLYLEYAKHPMAYDSLAALSPDSTHYNKGSPKSDPKLDSLKNIQKFLHGEYAKLNAGTPSFPKTAAAADYTEKLQKLQSELELQKQVQAQLDARAEQLKSLFGDKKISGLKSLQKAAFCAKEKRKNWERIAGDPDEAEEKALEYLKGVEGFEKQLDTKSQNVFGGLGNNASIEDLERLGFQTKGRTNQMMQDRFGDGLGDAQKRMGDELQQYQEQLNSVKGKIDEAKGKYAEANAQLTEGKQLKSKIRNFQKPDFRINPMRSLPFRERIQSAYDFQSGKAVSDERPAMLELGASVIYRQTEKWRFGAGMAASLGMGANWQTLHLSYEGLQFRVFTDREIMFGINVEAGFEQAFRPERAPVVEGYPRQQKERNDFMQEAFGKQGQSAYLGLMKTYKINKKWQGTFLVGYDFLWEKYDKRTPLMLRLGWEK